MRRRRIPAGRPQRISALGGGGASARQRREADVRVDAARRRGREARVDRRDEKLPAPRVRKRVSRMREHFRARWAAYVAALAAAGLAAILVFYIFRKKPEPQAIIVPERARPMPTAKSPLALAHDERARALEACDRAEWEKCVEGLDRAATADPEGDCDERETRARDAARKALAHAPAVADDERAAHATSPSPRPPRRATTPSMAPGSGSL